MEAGKLYIVATPIGNMGDITLRALEILKNSRYVVSEDTRVAGKLLNRYSIKAKLISYHKFNESKKTEKLIGLLKKGENMALVSDAGTPLISDPGFKLVEKAGKENITIEAIPGPSAVITALVLSGFDPGRFFFAGFLPRKKGEKKSFIEGLAGVDYPVVVFESPKRVKGALFEIKNILKKRKVSVIKEMTKMHERIYGGEIENVIEQMRDAPEKGEFVIVIGPCVREKEKTAGEAVIAAEIKLMIKQGVSNSEAVRSVSSKLGLKKNMVYKIANKIKQD